MYALCIRHYLRILQGRVVRDVLSGTLVLGIPAVLQGRVVRPRQRQGQVGYECSHAPHEKCALPPTRTRSARAILWQMRGRDAESRMKEGHRSARERLGETAAAKGLRGASMHVALRKREPRVMRQDPTAPAPCSSNERVHPKRGQKRHLALQSGAPPKAPSSVSPASEPWRSQKRALEIIPFRRPPDPGKEA